MPQDSQPILVFLHLAKTGGVTLSNILHRNFTPDFLRLPDERGPVSAMGTWSNGDVVKALSAMDAAQRDSLKLVNGHFRYGIHRHLPKPAIYITLLREPVDRLTSAFYYHDPRHPDGTRISLAEYVGNGGLETNIGFSDAMTRILSGSEVLDPQKWMSVSEAPPISSKEFDSVAAILKSFALVGTLDRFDEFLIFLARLLKLPFSAMVYERANVTPVRPNITDIDDVTKREILRLNSFDAQLVETAKICFDDQIEAYGRTTFFAHLNLFRTLNAAYADGLPLVAIPALEQTLRMQ